MSYEEAKRDIAEFAAKAFAKHQCRTNLVQSEHDLCHWFTCSTPGTSVHSFNLMFAPGVIAVWGDLGEWLIRHYEVASRAWLRSAVDSPGYLVSKIRAGEARVFYQDDAKAHLSQHSDELPDGLLEELADDFDEHEWHRAWHECGADEAPSCKYPSEAALWLVEALRWFVANS